MKIFDPTVDAITRLYRRGLLVETNDFGIKNLPDGRIQPYLKRKLKPKAVTTELEGACIDYGDMWAYYYDPFGGYVWARGQPLPEDYGTPLATVEWWKSWCARVIRMTYDPTGPSISGLTAYLDGGGTPYLENEAGDAISTPISFWFVPTGAAIQSLLADVNLGGDLPTPTDRSFSLRIGMNMYRKMRQTFDADGFRTSHDYPVGADETSAIPLVEWVCWNHAHEDSIFIP